MTWYTIGWGLIAGFALALEILALWDKDRGDTLSEHVWKVFMIRDGRNTPLGIVLRTVLLAFMVWLTGHLVFGVWTL